MRLELLKTRGELPNKQLGFVETRAGLVPLPSDEVWVEGEVIEVFEKLVDLFLAKLDMIERWFSCILDLRMEDKIGNSFYEAERLN